jgi:hypothetical protein
VRPLRLAANALACGALRIDRRRERANRRPCENIHKLRTLLRMGESPASTAARELVRARWGAQRPVKLARELAARVSELPATERERLRQALEAARVGGDAA